MTRAHAPFEKAIKQARDPPLPLALWIDGVCTLDEQSESVVRRLAISGIPTYSNDVLAQVLITNPVHPMWLIPSLLS